MTPIGDTFDSSVLLAHVAWVRDLARELVPADRHLAEDLAQDACLAALSRRPSTELPLAAWLGKVVRNLARQSKRGTSRRAARETDAAREEAEPSALDVVLKVAAHREVVEAVLELDEPYRTTILLRFYEDLAPAAIARAQGVPVATVKTRLARGIERLRAKLDGTHGADGRAWILALVPLFEKPGGSAAATLWSLIVSTNLKIAAAALAAIGGVALLWSSNRSTGAPSPSALAASPVAEPALEKPLRESLAQPAATSARVPETPPSPSVAVAAPAKAPQADGRTVRGRVLDLRSRPLSGVRLWFRDGSNAIGSNEFSRRSEEPGPASPSAESEADGRFAIAIPDASGRILSAEPKLATVLAWLCGPTTRNAEAIVVLAPRIELAGRVVAEDGRPLPDAAVVVALPTHFRKSFAEVLDGSEEGGWIARTDARGAFAMPDVPEVDGASLRVQLEGWPTHEEDAPQSTRRDLEIVMRRPRAEAGSVSGQVVDQGGRLVADARVALGTSVARTDEKGAFTMRVPEGGAKSPWTAVKQGYLPAIEAPSAAVESGTADGSEFVVLKLGPPPPSIEGRVVDRHGNPLAGVKVWPGEPTFFARIEEMPSQIEGLLAGAADRAEIEKILRSAAPGSNPEDVLMSTPTTFWPFVTTDAAGRFRIDGLLDHEYSLVAMDQETLLRSASDPIRAGRKNVELLLDVEAVYPRVAGRVVSASGVPVPRVTVAATCDVLTTKEGPGRESTFHSQGKVATTDAEGRFVLQRVPKEHVYLRLDGEDILPLEYGREEAHGIAGASHGEVESLELRVQVRHHFQVELSGPEATTVDEIEVLDGAGTRLPINLFLGNSRRTTDSVELKDGKSDALVVTEDARTLVLRSKGVEVRRAPLHLVAGQLNIVRP
jgi:RNA polymerase sigma-70 factor (ECF subfamily)